MQDTKKIGKIDLFTLKKTIFFNVFLQSVGEFSLKSIFYALYTTQYDQTLKIDLYMAH